MIAAIAAGVRALTAAARRANERGDSEELNRLLDEAEKQVDLMIAAMPPDLPANAHPVDGVAGSGSLV